MKVLHFIPNFNTVEACSVSKYKSALIRNMAGCADVHILTSQPPTLPLDNVVMHRYAPLKSFVPIFNSYFDKYLRQICPDVVHIHSCWNIHSFIFQKACIRCKIPVVLTVDRQLEQWHLLSNYWLGKLPKLLAYQYFMLLHADALHAICEQEKADLLHFCWNPYFKSHESINNKIVVVPTVRWKETDSLREMIDCMMRLYQKTIDSNPFMLMKEEDRQAEDLLLHTGVCYGHSNTQIKAADVVKISSLDNKAWRRLLLHSSDEKVLDYILTGIRHNNIAIPSFSQNKIDRFQRCERSKDAKAMAYGDDKIKRIKENSILTDVEKNVCAAVYNVLLKIRSGIVRRLDFVQLYQTLRFNAYDEGKVMHIMHSLRVEKEAARLLQILGEHYLLDEGFMFTEPLDDRRTKKIRKLLYKSNVQ